MLASDDSTQLAGFCISIWALISELLVSRKHIPSLKFHLQKKSLKGRKLFEILFWDLSDPPENKIS